MICVDIAEMKVSKNPEDILITPPLGSCVVVCVYDPEIKVGGMLNYMLPLSKSDPSKAKEMPYMFADTGVPRLFTALYEFGAEKHRMKVCLAGAGQVMGENQMYSLGRRNYMILRKMFLKNGIEISGEDIGGSYARKLVLEINNGKCVVKAQGKEREL